MSSSRILSIVYLEVTPPVLGDTAVRQGRERSRHRACHHRTQWQVAFSLAGNPEKQWRVSTCEGRESWGIDPSAPSVLTSGLLRSHFPSTLACHVHGQSNQGNPSGKETQGLAAGRPAGKGKVQPKSHGGRGTPTASAARPKSVCPASLRARPGDWKLTV